MGVVVMIGRRLVRVSNGSDEDHIGRRSGAVLVGNVVVVVVDAFLRRPSPPNRRAAARSFNIVAVIAEDLRIGRGASILYVSTSRHPPANNNSAKTAQEIFVLNSKRDDRESNSQATYS